MAQNNKGEHIAVWQVERSATDEVILHLLRCQECAERVLRLAVTLETTPIFEYPPAD